MESVQNYNFTLQQKSGLLFLLYYPGRVL